ncbi:MAG: hypothetical protein CMP49_02355 [Flavobacteriales bacterium]|nr:hypothetical protein [Flavobacteriales bacterium]|tara:strand:+ start:7720 stop:8952 length:1233 start_codon:yes stop_codon:yes gene_type:complete
MISKYLLLNYNIILKLISLLTFFKFLYPNKYRKWIVEQNNIFIKFKKNTIKPIWIHCSSLGEYEEIKILIPELKKINSNINITFFSLSGYQNFKDYHLINQISCLPFDSKSNMKKFINLINPMMVIIAKNDIWPNMITYLNKKNIPSYVIGFKLNENKQHNWLTNIYYENILTKFNFIFCENQASFKFLRKKNILNNIVIGNTRINQIIIDSKINLENTLISEFTANKKTIVYGSVEDGDYDKIIKTINKRYDFMHIIIPHEINKKNIQILKRNFPQKVLFYSKAKKSDLKKNNILIIDVFGVLKHIYKFTDIAYIGGGFNNGIHNTLEAAIHNNFMIFGPRHTNFSETFFFIEKNIAAVINNNLELEKSINYFIKKDIGKKEIHKITSSYFKKQVVNLQPIIENLSSLK